MKCFLLLGYLHSRHNLSRLVEPCQRWQWLNGESWQGWMAMSRHSIITSSSIQIFLKLPFRQYDGEYQWPNIKHFGFYCPFSGLLSETAGWCHFFYKLRIIPGTCSITQIYISWGFLTLNCVSDVLTLFQYPFWKSEQNPCWASYFFNVVKRLGLIDRKHQT